MPVVNICQYACTCTPRCSRYIPLAVSAVGIPYTLYGVW